MKKTSANRPPILAKLSAPRLGAVIPRPALFKRLDQARAQAQGVWISAPAGAGKTTLAADYLKTQHTRSLWYQFDERDADPATFFHYLREAAAGVSTRARRALAPLTPEYSGGLGIYARNFFEQLGTLVRPPATLVFDNCQKLPEQSPAYALLAEGLRALPDGVELLFMSHDDPPPEFAALQAQRLLAVIDQGSLTFNLAETRALAGCYGFDRLSATALKTLHERTHGWVAGTVLLLEQAVQQTGTDPCFDQPVTRTMFDYFAAEVLAGAPLEHQEVLLTTALLPQVNAQLAETLTGRPQAGRILADLANKRFFTYRLSGQPPTYQYHPLFREFLLTRLRNSITAEDYATRCACAAAIAAGVGNVDDAVSLWRQAGDLSQLVAYLPTVAPSLLEQGRSQALADWITAVPAAVRGQEPWLGYWLGQCRLPYVPAEARAHFESALNLFRSRGDRSGALLAWSGLVDVVLHEAQSYSLLDRWIELFPQIAGDQPLPAGIGDHIVVRMFGALVMRQPQHPDIDLWCQRSQAILQSGEDRYLRIWAGIHLSTYYVWVGDVGRSRQSQQLLSSLGRMPGVMPLAEILIRSSQAFHAWLVDTDGALSLKIVDQTLAYGLQVGVNVWNYHLACHGLAAALTCGDDTAARGMLDYLKNYLGQARLLDVGYYHSLRNWDALRRGDLVEAESHLRAGEAIRDDLGMPFGQGLLSLMGAQTETALGRFDAARRWLDKAHKVVSFTHSRLIAFGAAMGEADLALRSGDETRLRDWLARGFALAREHGLINYQGWHHTRMAVLCAHALEAGIETDYVRNLIARRALPPPADMAGGERWPWRLMIHTLGRFEIFQDGLPLALNAVGRKPLDLLAALIAYGGSDVGQERLTEGLWPDAEGDNARRVFDTTLHRLRKLLGNDTLLLKDGRLSLNTDRCWVDAWALERLLAELDLLLRCPGDDARVAQVADRILALSRGPFLSEHITEAWTLPARERLRSKLLRKLTALGLRWEAAQRWEQAIGVYQRVLEIEPLAEDCYRGIMRAHREQGQPAQALAIYERCRTALAVLLHMEPSAETEALRRGLLAAAGSH